MGHQTQDVWAVVRRQHGVISRRQLLAAGVHSEGIKHRVARGRLHPVHRGVYAAGRPHLTRHGRWMAAVLSCGSGAALSHESAAALWAIRDREAGLIEVTVRTARSRPGIRVHRRRRIDPLDLTVSHGIPVTSPVRSVLDLAARLATSEIEALVADADRADLVSPDAIRQALDHYPRRPGISKLRSVLDAQTFRMTDSELERRFLALVRSTGLPRPETGRHVDGYKVDFYWPALNLVAETDGLRYHRTAAQQMRDRLRDQAHASAGRRCLRFTHAQVRFDPVHVVTTLRAVADIPVRSSR